MSFSQTTIGGIPNVLPSVNDSVLFEAESNPGSGAIGYQTDALALFSYISSKYVPEKIIISATQLVSIDLMGKTIIANSPSIIALKLPVNAGLPANSEFDLIREGTGAVSVEAQAGVSINGIDSFDFEIPSQWSRLKARQILNNEWTITLYFDSGSSIPNDQNTYDASLTGDINLTTGKPRVYNSTDTGIRTPAMTQAQFQSIPSLLNGEQAWSSDVNRPLYQIGPDGAPLVGVGALLSDIAALQEDTVIGGCYLTAEAETTISAAGTFEQVSGVFAATKLIEFTVDSAGTLTYTGPETREMVVTASVSGSLNAQSDDIIIAAFIDNGITDIEILGTRSQVSLDGISPSFNAAVPIGPIQLSQGDKIRIKWTNLNSPAKNITAKTAAFLVHTVGGTETGVGVQKSHGGFWEQNAFLSIPISSVNAPAKITGSPNSFNLSSFSFSNDTLTYTGLDTKFFKVTLDVSAYLSVPGTNEANFFVGKNGGVLAPPQSTIIYGDPNIRQSCGVSVIVQLSTGDFLEAFVSNGTSTNSITVIGRCLIANEI